jgi:hypothetical protein
MAGMGLTALAGPLALARARQITGDWIPELAGRWDVIFTVPAGDLATVWVVEQTPSGATSVATVGPNPMALSLREVRRTDRRCDCPARPVPATPCWRHRLMPPRLQGRFTAGNLRGTFVATKRPDVRTHTLIEIFDQTIGTFEEMLFTATPFDAAWDARKAELQGHAGGGDRARSGAGGANPDRLDRSVAQ